MSFMQLLKANMAPDIASLKTLGDVNGLIKALSFRSDDKTFQNKAPQDEAEKMIRDKIYKCRQEAASALGLLGDRRAIEPLAILLASGMLDDLEVKKAAANAIGRIGGQEAVDPLCAVLGPGGLDWKVQETAAEALGRIGDPRAIAPLCAALDSTEKHMEVKKAAAEALAKYNDPAVIEPLLGVLASPIYAGSRAKEAAIKALGNFADKRAMAPLCAVLDSPTEDQKAKKAAAEALGNFGKAGGRPVVECLCRALQKSNQNFFTSIEITLLTFGEEASQPLQAILVAGDEAARNKACWILDQLKWQPTDDRAGAVYWVYKGNFNKCVAIGAEALDPLANVLADGGSKSDFAEILPAIRKIGTPAAVAALVKILGFLDEGRKEIRKASNAGFDSIWGARNERDQMNAVVNDLFSHMQNSTKREEIEDREKVVLAALKEIGSPAAENAIKEYEAKHKTK